MRKYKIFACLVYFLFVPSLFLFSFARDEHNAIFEKVMFSNYNTVSKERIKLLEDASYLCLDQFNGAGQRQLDNLRTNKVKNIPKTVDEFNFSDGSYHRRYTHRGWNYSYINDKANWSIRKRLLMGTVKKVFKNANESQVDSISALTYYIHILGDLLHADNIEHWKKINPQMIDFAKSHASKGDPDLCFEIEKNIQSLFDEREVQKSFTYNLFKRKLDRIHKNAIDIESNKYYQGGLITDKPNDIPGTRYKEYYKCIENYVNTLEEYLPELLDPLFKEFS